MFRLFATLRLCFYTILIALLYADSVAALPLESLQVPVRAKTSDGALDRYPPHELLRESFDRPLGPGSSTLFPLAQTQHSSSTTASTPTSLRNLNTTATSTTRSHTPSSTSLPQAPASIDAHPLHLSIINSLLSEKLTGRQGSATFHAYITGRDRDGKVVLVGVDGSFFYLSTTSDTPQPVTADVAYAITQHKTTIKIPDYLSSGRIWFSEGLLEFAEVSTVNGPGLVTPTSVNPNDASHDVRWGFCELTWISDGLWANPSAVDFVGLPVGLKLERLSGDTHTSLGLPKNAARKVCHALKRQALRDAQPWGDLCQYDASGALIRVNSPASVIASNATMLSSYWTNYVDAVWSKYSSQALTITPQNGLPDVECRVNANVLTCQGDSRTYAKPIATDIFGCASGPFSVLATDNNIHAAVVPRLCAAFNRATLLLEAGHIQPSLEVLPDAYYSAQPNNWYSRIIHRLESNGTGYAFSYDDVAPSYQYDTSGLLVASDPKLLEVTVGGFVPNE